MVQSATEEINKFKKNYVPHTPCILEKGSLGRSGCVVSAECRLIKGTGDREKEGAIPGRLIILAFWRKKKDYLSALNIVV